MRLEYFEKYPHVPDIISDDGETYILRVNRDTGDIGINVGKEAAQLHLHKSADKPPLNIQP